MDYDEFILQAQLDLAKEMPGAVVTLKNIGNPQESYEGLCVTPENSQLVVVLNMFDAYFSKIAKGGDYGEILSKMVEVVEESTENFSRIDAEIFSDYGRIRDRLTEEMVWKKQFQELLEDIPYFDMDDHRLLVYRIDVSDMVECGEKGWAAVLITNQMLEKCSVTLDQLYWDTMESILANEPLVFESQMVVNSDRIGIPLLETEGEAVAYGATNKPMAYGASVIAYPDSLEKAADQVDDSKEKVFEPAENLRSDKRNNLRGGILS